MPTTSAVSTPEGISVSNIHSNTPEDAVDSLASPFDYNEYKSSPYESNSVHKIVSTLNKILLSHQEFLLPHIVKSGASAKNTIINPNVINCYQQYIQVCFDKVISMMYLIIIEAAAAGLNTTGSICYEISYLCLIIANPSAVLMCLKSFSFYRSIQQSQL